MAESNVAVLIDFENVGGLDNIQYLLDQLSDVGRVIVKRAYADWSAHRGMRDQLLELGVEARHLFRSTKSGKNSSDILLALDAVDLQYGAPVDTFVIVSSDSDFVPLVSKLRAAGKSVIGAGRPDAASPTLIRSCDRYIFLEDKKVPDQKRRRRASEDTDVSSLLVRAVAASVDDQGQVLGSKLHQTMQRIDPSFDFKALGNRTFTQFLSRFDEVKVTRPPNASDVLVQSNHSRDIGAHDNDGPLPPLDWERNVDAAWVGRQQSKVSGRAAASDAAKVLGVPSLRASNFPSLDKLLAASELLRTRWRRDGNTIVKA